MKKVFVAAPMLASMLVVLGPTAVALADDADSTAVAATDVERPDFSGHWTARTGPGIYATKDENGNICVIRCGRPPAEEGEAAPPTPRRRAPEFPVYREEHKERVAKLKEEQVLHDPVLKCLNPGLPRIGPPDKIVQKENELVILYDDLSGAFWRVIPTDGRPHKEYAERNFFGDSVGHWEGNKLIIESVSFSDESWLTDNGAFHTANMRVVEELSPAEEEGAIVYRVTVHDPEVLAEPWTRERTLRPSTNELLEPVPCVEMSIDKMTGITSYHPNSRW